MSKPGRESKSKKVIIYADALSAYERAFRTSNPSEVETLLREMLNVQVAVVDDVESAKQQIAQGKRLKTVTVPYGVFLEKSENKTVWFLDFKSLNKTDFIRKINTSEEILPNRTYILLKNEAGYNKIIGLTFEGEGEITGFEDESEEERREKFTEGRFQTWKEHSKGVWERSERIAELYRPFIEVWAEKVLNEHWENEKESREFVDSLLLALRLAVALHDVGKLNRKWQKIFWKIEEHLQGGQISKSEQDPFIARTSQIPSEVKKKLQDILKEKPMHAPFAYPFIKTLLRKLLGDYRFCDLIALAISRHHSLEVTGALSKDEFKWDDNAEIFLKNFICEIIGELTDEDKTRLEEAFNHALKAISNESKADEPPGPTDDFYFLYCITNRFVKVCDWEDAGDKIIELKT